MYYTVLVELGKGIRRIKARASREEAIEAALRVAILGWRVDLIAGERLADWLVDHPEWVGKVEELG